MKLKNAQKGVRVELKVDYNHLKTGSVGVIVQGDDTMPYVEWDDYHKANHDAYGVKNGHCWAVEIEYLRKG